MLHRLGVSIFYHMKKLPYLCILLLQDLFQVARRCPAGFHLLLHRFLVLQVHILTPPNLGRGPLRGGSQQTLRAALFEHTPVG